MTFRNVSRTLLLLAGSLSLTLGLTSCSADHTVGYIYVLGTQYNQISELREDNNNGSLANLKGSPIGSGGINPIRAVVPSGDRYMYVLNGGQAAKDPTSGNITYSSSSIALFSVGGYGQLTTQLQYSSQGYGPQRIAVDSGGAHLFVLDEYSPVGLTGGSTTSPTGVIQSGPTTAYPCKDPDTVNFPNTYHPVGDVTVFTIDQSTGRLQAVQNPRQLNINYFPVGCFPVDFGISSSFLYTMDAGSATNNDLQTVFVYSLGTNGQLTPTQTTTNAITDVVGGVSNPVNISALNVTAANLYLLDTQNDKIYIETPGSSGALTPVDGSPFTNSQTQAGGPVQSIVDSTNKYLYVADGGTASGTFNPNGNSDIAGFNQTSSNGSITLVPVQNSPFAFAAGTISNPVCIFEDPTNQYIYTAGSVDNSITGRRIDPNTGTLSTLNKAGTFPTTGTPSWCLGISSAF